MQGAGSVRRLALPLVPPRAALTLSRRLQQQPLAMPLCLRAFSVSFLDVQRARGRGKLSGSLSQLQLVVEEVEFGKAAFSESLARGERACGEPEYVKERCYG